jgi:CHAD domain-containing protein
MCCGTLLVVEADDRAGAAPVSVSDPGGPGGTLAGSRVVAGRVQVRGPGGGDFWSAEELSAVTAAVRALETTYTVTMGQPVSTRRTWLDSADWRLYRAGMALAATSATSATSGANGGAGGAETLELSSADGATVTAGPDTLGWPRLLAELPDGLRPHLETVLGVRALLPVVRVSGSVVPGRLLDDEGKTVVRLVHERPATIAGSRARLPGGLRLIPLRGYATAGARAGRLVHCAGLLRDDRSGYAAALAAAGVDPDAPARAALGPGLPGDVAVARVLLSFLDEMEAAWDGTVADVDIEFLHDFRVGVRRSRSAVKLLGDLLPADLVAWAAPQLKWLGDLTTPSRDLDVHLQELPSLAARLSSSRAETLVPMELHLRRLRAAERRRLVRGLRSARFERWRERWRVSLEELAAREASAAPPVEEIGPGRLAAAYRRVLRRGSRITPASPAEDLHDLRKRCKELRYLLETFTPLLDPGGARSAVKELKAVQEVLGAFQDSEAQRDAIYALATDMTARPGASVPTLLAMGEAAAQLHLAMQSSRAEFAATFARFARRSVGHRMARLGPPGRTPAGGAPAASVGATP